MSEGLQARDDAQWWRCHKHAWLTPRLALLPLVLLQVVEMGVGYQAKIDALWQGYESKKAEEAALLAKSEAILAGLVSVWFGAAVG